MNKLAALIGVSIAATISSVALAAKPEIDFKAVNPILQSLVDAVVVADDTVDYAYPKFDEKVSNLKENRIKYDIQGALKNTPWLEGGRAEIKASVRMEVEPETHEFTNVVWGDKFDGHIMAVTSSAEVKTDTLAMLRYGAELVLKKAEGYDKEYEERIKAHLKRMSVATSLDEYYGNFYSWKKLGRNALSKELDKKQKRHECAQDFDCYKKTYVDPYPGVTFSPSHHEETKESAARNLRHLEKSIEAYDLIDLKPTYAAGRVTEVSVIIDQKVLDALPKPINSHIQPKKPFPFRFEMKLQDGALSTTLKFWGSMPNKSFVNLKSNLNRILPEVQQGNIQEKQKTEDAFRKALIIFKKALRGEPV